MDPITASLIASFAAPAVGGVLGNIFGSDDQDKAEAARKSALDAILGIKVPGIEEQKLNLEKYQSAGNLTPEMQTAIEMGKSRMEGIQVDPRLKDAQMGALKDLAQVGSGGMTAIQRAELEENRRNALAASNAQSQAVLQNMAARGVGGSGAELAARLSAGQNAANQMAASGDRLQAMAMQNALDAKARAAALGGQMRTQEFGEQADIARAADAINQFNVRNRQAVSDSNVQAKNAAQQFNLGNKQQLMNSNTGLSNQQQTHNKGLYQQQFNNRLAQGQSAAGQYGQMGNYYNDQAGATRGMWAGIGSAVGQGAGSYGAYAQGQQRSAQDQANSDRQYDLLKKIYGIT